MSSLLKALPGLDRFAARKVPAPPVPFDYTLVERRVRDVWCFLSARYPSGALPWVRRYRPDLVTDLRTADAALDASCLTENMSKVSDALEGWQKTYERAFAAFVESRDNLQGSLL